MNQDHECSVSTTFVRSYFCHIITLTFSMFHVNMGTGFQHIRPNIIIFRKIWLTSLTYEQQLSK